MTQITEERKSAAFKPLSSLYQETRCEVSDLPAGARVEPSALALPREAALYTTVLPWVSSATPATADAQMWPFRPCGTAALAQAPRASDESEQDPHRPFGLAPWH